MQRCSRRLCGLPAGQQHRSCSRPSSSSSTSASGVSVSSLSHTACCQSLSSKVAALRICATPTEPCKSCSWSRCQHPCTQTVATTLTHPPYCVCAHTRVLTCLPAQAKPAGGFSFGSAPAFGAASTVGLYLLHTCCESPWHPRTGGTTDGRLSQHTHRAVGTASLFVPGASVRVCQSTYRAPNSHAAAAKLALLYALPRRPAPRTPCHAIPPKKTSCPSPAARLWVSTELPCLWGLWRHQHSCIRRSSQHARVRSSSQHSVLWRLWRCQHSGVWRSLELPRIWDAGLRGRVAFRNAGLRLWSCTGQHRLRHTSSSSSLPRAAGERASFLLHRPRQPRSALLGARSCPCSTTAHTPGCCPATAPAWCTGIWHQVVPYQSVIKHTHYRLLCAVPAMPPPPRICRVCTGLRQQGRPLPEIPGQGGGQRHDRQCADLLQQHHRDAAVRSEVL